LAAHYVTVAEWVVLRSLYGGDAMSPSSLAHQIGWTRGAISKLADRLLEKGLIERTINRDDKRTHSLRLSESGEATVPLLAELADRNDEAFFAVLSAEEHIQLAGLLQKLIDKHRLSSMQVD
jgi:DNA-binding MarR family transcriptional regulator